MKSPARMDFVGKSKRIFPSITGRKLLYPESELKLAYQWTRTVKPDIAKSYNAEVEAASCALARTLTFTWRKQASYQTPWSATVIISSFPTPLQGKKTVARRERNIPKRDYSFTTYFNRLNIKTNYYTPQTNHPKPCHRAPLAETEGTQGQPWGQKQGKQATNYYRMNYRT